MKLQRPFLPPLVSTFILILLFFTVYPCDGCADEGERAASQKRSPGERDKDNFNFSVGTYFTEGQISGYLQTGEGGHTGTGTTDRPNIRDDLGFKRATRLNYFAEARWSRHSILAEDHLLHLRGESVLDRSLIYHGVSYPAGTKIETEFKSNWYEIAYMYRIGLDSGTAFLNRQRHKGIFSAATFTFIPLISIAYWDFYLNLKDGVKNERKYSHVTPRFGALLEWKPLSKFSMTAKAVRSFPYYKSLFLETLELSARYELFHTDSLSLCLNLGGGTERLRYEDTQAFPNEIKVNLEPMVMIGAQVKF